MRAAALVVLAASAIFLCAEARDAPEHPGAALEAPAEVTVAASLIGSGRRPASSPEPLEAVVETAPPPPPPPPSTAPPPTTEPPPPPTTEPPAPPTTAIPVEEAVQEEPEEEEAVEVAAGGSTGGACGGDLPSCSIMMCESGGSLTAYNRASGAAGKWQIIRSTWDGYGGYEEASDAPESVQDERARQIWAGGAGRGQWEC